jgi:hypothetical protein
MNTKLAAALVAFLIILHSAGNSQVRRGPKNRDVILDARLDPAFSSTPIGKLALLPFGNELDYPEGAMMLAENFLGAMRQKHSDMVVASPQETLQLIRDLNLFDDYKRFLGTYINTGVITIPFLEAFGRTGKFDGIMMGKVVAYGTSKEIRQIGGFSWGKEKAVVAMEIMLLRTRDGREMWWGTHGVEGAKNENVKDLAKIVGEVLAIYFGRLPY